MKSSGSVTTNFIGESHGERLMNDSTSTTVSHSKLTPRATTFWQIVLIDSWILAQ